MKKILVSDYDQTFYLNDEDIEKNKIAVEKFRKEGNIFVIATGRSYFDFTNKVNQYNIKYDYVIINHGATILDKDDNIFCNFQINNEIIKNIEKDLQIEYSIKNFCCSKLESRVDFNHKDLTKINVKYNNRQKALEVEEKLKSKYSDYINCYNISQSSIEIISNEIDKSKAISILLKKLNISKDNVYTIGDGYSDIRMIRDFNGYVMKNSVEALQRLNKKECESVYELINILIKDEN